jgi:hypothetical protein
MLPHRRPSRTVLTQRTRSRARSRHRNSCAGAPMGPAGFAAGDRVHGAPSRRGSRAPCPSAHGTEVDGAQVAGMTLLPSHPSPVPRGRLAHPSLAPASLCLVVCRPVVCVCAGVLSGQQSTLCRHNDLCYRSGRSTRPRLIRQGELGRKQDGRRGSGQQRQRRQTILVVVQCYGCGLVCCAGRAGLGDGRRSVQ